MKKRKKALELAKGGSKRKPIYDKEGRQKVFSGIPGKDEHLKH